jgi:ankyrin repeat protein
VKKGRDPNLPDQYRWIALHRAAANNRARIAELLIDAGSSLTARGTEGWTPLHLAAASGSTDVVSVLIKAGSDVNDPSDRGDTPLHLCVMSDRVVAHVGLRAAPLLLKAGARVDISNKKGLSPLTKAETQGATKMAVCFRRYLGSTDK